MPPTLMSELLRQIWLESKEVIIGLATSFFFVAIVAPLMMAWLMGTCLIGFEFFKFLIGGFYGSP